MSEPENPQNEQYRSLGEKLSGERTWKKERVPSSDCPLPCGTWKKFIFDISDHNLWFTGTVRFWFPLYPFRTDSREKKINKSTSMKIEKWKYVRGGIRYQAISVGIIWTRICEWSERVEENTAEMNQLDQISDLAVGCMGFAASLLLSSVWPLWSR